MSDQYLSGITLLGAHETTYQDQYNPKLLETFSNTFLHQNTFITLHCPEFTSLCPITGQPDFAAIRISYVPNAQLVESKSLKLYLFSFRNHGSFHENCIHVIMTDLIELMDPHYIEVCGKFTPRGGIAIDPYVNYGRNTTQWQVMAQERFAHYSLISEPVRSF